MSGILQDNGHADFFPTIKPLSLNSRMRIKSKGIKRWFMHRDVRPLSTRMIEDEKTGMLYMESRIILECMLSMIWTFWPFYHFFQGTSEAFKILAKTLPPQWWGSIFGATSIVLLTLYIYGHCGLRRIGAAWTIVLFGGVEGLLVYENSPGWAVALVLPCVLFEIFRWVKLKECGEDGVVRYHSAPEMAMPES